MTVTSCGPVAAVLATVILATICVAVRELYEFTVIPVPPNERTAAGSKLFPFTVKFGMVWPWVPEMGRTEVIEGGLGAGLAAGLFRNTETKLESVAAERSIRPSPSKSPALGHDCF